MNPKDENISIADLFDKMDSPTLLIQSGDVSYQFNIERPSLLPPLFQIGDLKNDKEENEGYVYDFVVFSQLDDVSFDKLKEILGKGQKTTLKLKCKSIEMSSEYPLENIHRIECKENQFFTGRYLSFIKRRNDNIINLLDVMWKLSRESGGDAVWKFNEFVTSTYFNHSYIFWAYH